MRDFVSFEMAGVLMRRWVAVPLLALFVLLIPLISAAQEAKTPSHVYQISQQILAELDLIHAANETQPVSIGSDVQPQNLRPRHVLQNARTTYSLLQTLRGLNNLSVSETPDLPDQEVSPGNVADLLQLLLTDIVSLKEAFYVTEEAPEVPFVEGKKPGDVYMALSAVKRSLAPLGIPKTVPNDVFKHAEDVMFGAHAVAAVNGGLVVSAQDISAGKSPADVYGMAFDILDQMERIGQKDEMFMPVGGFAKLNKKDAKITPADVLNVIAIIKAELHSISVINKLGVDMDSAILTGGNSPSNVFDVLVSVHSTFELL